MTEQDPRAAAESMWQKLADMADDGDIEPKQLVNVAKALIHAVQEVHAGTAPNVLASLARLPAASGLGNVLPLLTAIAPVGIAFGALLVMMTVTHGMPVGSAEEKQWFDRASGGSG
jgi:ABC-type uncharacterized transport system YnjBCD permease subunit